MNAEQVVRNFLAATESNDLTAGAIYLANGLVFSGGMLLQSGGVKEVARIGSALREAFPDFRWNIQHVWTQDEQVTVKLVWSGTQCGPLKLGYLVGATASPAILATGKQIRVPETFIFTVRGDRSHGCE